MKSKKTFMSLFTAFILIAAPITTYAQTVASGLTWNSDVVVQGNLAKYCYSELVGYNYHKWVKCVLGQNSKTSGWIGPTSGNAYTELYGSFWDTAYTYYDFY